MFARELHHRGHTKRFVVRASAGEGWEVREEEDSAVTKRVCYHDWHRVERAIQGFDREIERLEDDGWAPGRRS